MKKEDLRIITPIMRDIKNQPMVRVHSVLSLQVNKVHDYKNGNKEKERGSHAHFSVLVLNPRSLFYFPMLQQHPYHFLIIEVFIICK